MIWKVEVKIFVYTVFACMHYTALNIFLQKIEATYKNIFHVKEKNLIYLSADFNLRKLIYFFNMWP